MSSLDNSTFINDINKIYTAEYAVKNLYRVEIYDTFNDGVEDFLNYLSLQAPSVSFKGESLDLTRNNVTRNFQLREDGNSFNWTDELSIKWRERDDWEVRKYHEKWLGEFYDKEKDCFLSKEAAAIPSLYRTIIVTLPESKTNSSAPHTIKFFYVLPKTIGDFELGWGSGADNIEHQLTYYVKYWKWE